jgi:2-oxoglutarate dehydrogenase E1 component
MYLIEEKRSVRKLYTEALDRRGDITVEDAEAVMTRFRERLELVFREVRGARQPRRDMDYSRVPAYPKKSAAKHGTAISMENLKKIADAHTTFPSGFTVHPKVMPQLQRRAAAITQGPIDWATAEIVALGSLLLEGRTVRLTGRTLGAALSFSASPPLSTARPASLGCR